MTCKSSSKFGDCGLPAEHDGEHAVPIEDGLWFVYPETTGTLGYARLIGGVLIPLFEAVESKDCNYCKKYSNDSMMPPHTPSKNCDSGKRSHCTCDDCY